MGLVIEKFLICDGTCGDNFGVDTRGDEQTGRTLRQGAKENGWTTSGTYDWCPECSAELKEPTK